MSAAEVHQLPRSGARVPPHSVQAEESLLGAMLLSREAIDVAVEHVTGESFYRPAHADIFEAILGLHVAGQPADAVTVAEELRAAGALDRAGGAAALLTLQGNTPSTTGAVRYAKIVAGHATMRRLAVAGAEIVEMGMTPTDDVPAVIDEAEALVFELADRDQHGGSFDLATTMTSVLDRIEERFENGEAISGMPSGLHDLDDLLSGLQPGATYVIGARPSVGKTALALSIAHHVAVEARQPVLAFSLEMGNVEIGQRLLSMDARVDSQRMMKGRLDEGDWAKIGQSVGRLAEAPLWIEDDPRMSVTQMRAKARRLKAKQGGLALIIVDYVQLMTGRSGAENRQVEVSEISRGLKILARELQCPVLVLSQLSRALEMRADKRPMLSDLRESGSLEQDADVVMLLYRDEVYMEDSPDRGTAEIIVAKHRNGPTGVVRTAFLSHFTRFANMAKGV